MTYEEIMIRCTRYLPIDMVSMDGGKLVAGKNINSILRAVCSTMHDMQQEHLATHHVEPNEKQNT